MILKKCLLCGTEIPKSKNNHKQKFCSKGCASINSMKNKEKTLNSHRRKPKDLTEAEYHSIYCKDSIENGVLLTSGYTIITNKNLSILADKVSSFEELFLELHIVNCSKNRIKFKKRFKRIGVNKKWLFQERRVNMLCRYCGLNSSSKSFCSEDCKNKTKNRKYVSAKNFYLCVICKSKTFQRKTCSKKCLSKLQALNSANALRERQRTNGKPKSSKLEKIFEEFLKNKNVPFRREVHARNLYNTGYYRLDFVIKNKKLIVEIDGKHHEKPLQIRKDVVRDYHLTNRGWKVIRINYFEVNMPQILEMIYTKFIGEENEKATSAETTQPSG